MAVKVSGFSFVHNALAAGYPLLEAVHSVLDYVDEMVIVDCQSDDGTRKLLERLGVRIIDGQWGNRAGETLKAAHALHCQCAGDVIIHFEADEVFDRSLIKEINIEIEMGNHNLAVWRLQLEQNFQRCRWYPEPVHRVFPKGAVVKEGHTTNWHDKARVIEPKWGYLWDITNCFRDQWLKRNHQQANLWNEEPQYRRVPIHFTHSELVPDVDRFLSEPHWTWETTPFVIPEILRPLVGKTKYEVAL